MFTHSARVNLTHSYISHIIENSDHFRIKYGFICDYAYAPANHVVWMLDAVYAQHLTSLITFTFTFNLHLYLTNHICEFVCERVCVRASGV